MQLFSKKINFPPFSTIFLAKISTLGVRDGAIYTRNTDQADDVDTLLHHVYDYSLLYIGHTDYIYRHTSP